MVSMPVRLLCLVQDFNFMLASYDRFYLEHVIELSKTEKIVFIDNVLTDKNMMLLERDTVFNPHIYDLLRKHKLQKPLDDLIFVSHRLEMSDVIARIWLLIKQTPYLQALCKSLPQRELAVNTISHVALSIVLLNKLTVMQRRLPDLFDHSIQVAMMAVAIGSELRVAGPLLTMLATAGLLHDLGELHINPQLYQAKTKLSETEWREIYTHPLIAFAILNQCPEIPIPVAKAVLEHHERMNGSGYPQGFSGNKLGHLGRILAVAEVVTAICQKEPVAQVATLFKSCNSNLDDNVVKAVHALLRRMITQISPIKTDLAGAVVDTAELSQLCRMVTRIMRAWKKLGPTLDEHPMERARRLFERITQIQYSLLDAGVQPDDCEESVKKFVGETEPLREILTLLREVCFQLGAAINETQRGWNFNAEKKSDTTIAVDKWLRQTRNTLNQLGNANSQIDEEED
ncbi:MAG: HD domain-containing protein [Methylococcaceae bacterium]|nr:MAG: HD domain-containing protein [Methylococcaceae bacterium]